MTEAQIIHLVIEIAVILLGLFAMYWKTKVENEHRFTRLETMIHGQKNDHMKIEGRLIALENRMFDHILNGDKE